MPSAIARMADHLHRLRGFVDHAVLREPQPEPAGGEDDAGLDRPEDAVERRADIGAAADPSTATAHRATRSGNAGRSATACRRADPRSTTSRSTILVCASVWIFVARSQRRWSIADADQPRERADAEHDADHDLEADEDVFDRVGDLRPRCPEYCWPPPMPPRKNTGLCATSGCCDEKGRQRRIQAPGSRVWSAATGRAAAPGRPTAGIARRFPAAVPACRGRCARPRRDRRRGGLGRPGRRRPSLGLAGRACGRQPRPAASASGPPFLSSLPSIYAAGGRKLTSGHGPPPFHARPGARPVRAAGASRGAVAPRSRHQREDPPGREQPFADHEDAAHAGRRLRPARDRVAEPQGRGRMGDRADAIVGLQQRPSRAVGLRPSRLGQRALLGAHHRAGQGSAHLRGAGVDAGDRRHRHRAGLSAADAGSPDAGAALIVPGR